MNEYSVKDVKDYNRALEEDSSFKWCIQTAANMLVRTEVFLVNKHQIGNIDYMNFDLCMMIKKVYDLCKAVDREGPLSRQIISSTIVEWEERNPGEIAYHDLD